MDVLVLGNGFDLAHLLPTTYLSFLKTTEFIAKQHSIQDLTIGQVFNAIKNECDVIQKSYDAYKSVYDNHVLNKDVILKIKDLCDRNEWWQYFKKTYNKRVGWIDFEKEIASVIKKINNFIDATESSDSFSMRNETGLIALHFKFFVEPTQEFSASVNYHCVMVHQCRYRYNKEYLVSSSKSSKKTVDRSKIAENLFKELLEFSQILGLYFELFVEDTIEALKAADLIQLNKEYEKFVDIVTYNYTNSFEAIYNKEKAAHIHGALDKDIILGINPDTNDEIDGDLSFISFKKYYQRVVFGTDLDYLHILIDMKNLVKHEQTAALSIVGHSLDVTDKDSLRELFEASNDIKIYYHKKEKIPEYVQNLIRFFGKTKFDELRYDRHLRFLPLNELKGPNPGMINHDRFFRLGQSLKGLT